MDNFQEKVAFIWSVADLLRGDYKQSEYGKVILPLTVLRRLDSVLEPTKARVLKRNEDLKGRLENVDSVLNQITGHGFNKHLAVYVSYATRRPDQRGREPPALHPRFRPRHPRRHREV